jgi:hypothetical protein
VALAAKYSSIVKDLSLDREEPSDNETVRGSRSGSGSVGVSRCGHVGVSVRESGRE